MSLLLCYRCGASLDALTLPLSRRDLCPSCSTELHVCLMCANFDASVPKQCREDDAEEVTNKGTANFCEWFEPSADAFDSASAKQQNEARAALDALFGDSSDESSADKDGATQAAEDLFKT